MCRYNINILSLCRSLSVRLSVCILQVVNGTLIIRNVMSEEEGQYMCSAVNSVGSATATVMLTVNCELDERERERERESMAEPIFLSSLLR